MLFSCYDNAFEYAFQIFSRKLSKGSRESTARMASSYMVTRCTFKMITWTLGSSLEGATQAAKKFSLRM